MECSILEERDYYSSEYEPEILKGHLGFSYKENRCVDKKEELLH